MRAAFSQGSAARLALLLTLASCGAPRGLYLWDGYEDSVRQMTSPEADLDVDAQIEAMRTLVERSREGGRPVAPGIHAQLGYLYSLRGDIDNAVAALESEAELYPESRVFIEGLLERLKGAGRRVDG